MSFISKRRVIVFRVFVSINCDYLNYSVMLGGEICLLYDFNFFSFLVVYYAV